MKAATPASWKPGQSGNPGGRPPKGRTWTDLIDKAGRRRLALPDGSKVSAKKFAAQRLVELLTHGKTQLIDGTDIEVNGDGWFSIYKWAVLQIDGPAQASVDVTSRGEQMGALPIVALDYRTLAAPLTARPVGDPEPSGEIQVDQLREAVGQDSSGQ